MYCTLVIRDPSWYGFKTLNKITIDHGMAKQNKHDQARYKSGVTIMYLYILDYQVK